jgi:hypothetical protein
MCQVTFLFVLAGFGVIATPNLITRFWCAEKNQGSGVFIVLLQVKNAVSTFKKILVCSILWHAVASCLHFDCLLFTGY